MFRKLYFALFFSRRFYFGWGLLAGLFALSFGLPGLFPLLQVAAALFALAIAIDLGTLFARRDPLRVERIVPDKIGNGEETTVRLALTNTAGFRQRLEVIDELPDQLQVRGLVLQARLEAGMSAELTYPIRPLERGEYLFHRTNVFIRTPLGMVIRRKKYGDVQTVRVVPAFSLLRHFEWLAFHSTSNQTNARAVRRTGHSLEFEQIREYVAGDDIRNINWNATARTGGRLMVNAYTDEKSQQLYCLIDKGRAMKMPFDGLTLLDYAINATLILCGVALGKQDRAGLVLFAESASDFLPANHQTFQMNAILETLYNQRTRFLETDFGALNGLVKTRIPQRSLLVLFTNFESLTSLRRQLPFLRSLARKHLVLVVFFENTELADLTRREPDTVEHLYEKVIAEQFIQEKKAIVRELQTHGIQALLTAPGDLSVNVVNRYLDIKARRQI